MKTFFLVVMAALTGFSVSVQADTFTDSFGDFNDNQAGGSGITFTPAKATIKPPSTVIPQTVFLVDWTFAKSSSGYGGDVGTYLAITAYDSVTGYDLGHVLGVSTNYIDFPAAENGSLITWQFDYIALDIDTEYALLFVVKDEAGQLYVSSGGVELEVSVDYPWGGFIGPYSTIVDYPDWNAHFEATYSTTTPYPYGLFPSYGTPNVEINETLSWEVPTDYTPTGYNVYIDPNEYELNAVSADYYSAAQPGTTFTPSPDFEFATTYRWCVEAIAPGNVVYRSQVSMFTTRDDTVIITDDPAYQTVPIDTPQVEFSVSAVSAEAYQWYKDGSPLAENPSRYTGENTATLTVYDVQLDDEGLYACEVSNSVPSSAMSGPALLITERLAGWWKLDGNLTDSVALAIPDVVTHNGTSPDPNFVEEGKDGGALKFFGDPEGLVTITNSSDFFNFYPQGYSVSCWVNMPVKADDWTDPWGAFVAKQTPATADPAAPARGFVLTNDNIGNAVHTLRQSFSDLYSGFSADTNNWHLVTGTYDAATGEGRIYFDGTLRNQATSSVVPDINSASLIFGAENIEQDPLVAPYSGLLDDIRIWTYPLDKTEVADLYINFNPGAVLCLEDIDMDISGPEGTPDCVVDLYDFAAFAEDWLICNRVPASSCLE